MNPCCPGLPGRPLDPRSPGGPAGKLFHVHTKKTEFSFVLELFVVRNDLTNKSAVLGSPGVPGSPLAPGGPRGPGTKPVDETHTKVHVQQNHLRVNAFHETSGCTLDTKKAREPQGGSMWPRLL